MLYALVNGVKSEATPNGKALCPFCDHKMIAKCGEFVSWHWAHERAANCDSWYQPETEWHRKWKAVFGKDNCEIILNKDGIKHIADIKTIHGCVIELQNSPINYEKLIEREDFYGPDMIWIINGIQFADNFKILPIHGLEYDTYTPEFDRFAKMHGFTPNYSSEKNTGRFEWKRPKKVWSLAGANVYIDFGNEFLFKINKWSSDSKGIGDQISKKQFISNHGGNISLLSGLWSINKSLE